MNRFYCCGRIDLLFSIQKILGTTETIMNIAFKTSSGVLRLNRIFEIPKGVSIYGWKGANRISIPEQGSVIVVVGTMSPGPIIPVEKEAFSGSASALDDLLENEHVFILRLSVKESALLRQNK